MAAFFRHRARPSGRIERNQAWKDTLPRFSQSPAALDQGRYARFETFLKRPG
jgi:putative hydroxymethylpyrimidine transport system substrate-binding protein